MAVAERVKSIIVEQLGVDEEAEKISNVREAVEYIQNNTGDQN